MPQRQDKPALGQTHLARAAGESFHLSLFSPHVCARVCGGPYTRTHTPVDVRDYCLESSSISLRLSFFRESFSLNLELPS